MEKPQITTDNDINNLIEQMISLCKKMDKRGMTMTFTHDGDTAISIGVKFREYEKKYIEFLDDIDGGICTAINNLRYCLVNERPEGVDDELHEMLKAMEKYHQKIFFMNKGKESK